MCISFFWGSSIVDWPGQSKIDPHRFEDGNHFSFDPTVKVFRLERFADFKKKSKVSNSGNSCFVFASSIISNQALVEDLFNRITP